MEIKEILTESIARGASDIFLVGGLPLTFKIHSRHVRISDERLFPDELTKMITELYAMIDRQMKDFHTTGEEDDFSFALPGLGRFRANVFLQRGSLSAVIRIIKFGIPNPYELNIPESVIDIADLNKGLVLITGAAGSGKSTTIACIIDEINSKHDKTIITIEDPIEFVHNHKKSIVIQREITVDTKDFLSGLLASLRESPDVLLLGEIRDAKTMEVAMTAAETGQLVMGTLHTNSAADTVDRIVDEFPPARQKQVLAQLARVLRVVVCQHLIPTKDGTLIPAFEIMKVNTAIRNLIREGKIHQFDQVIQTSSRSGMIMMDASIADLVNKGIVDRNVAANYVADPDTFEKKIFIR